MSGDHHAAEMWFLHQHFSGCYFRVSALRETFLVDVQRATLLLRITIVRQKSEKQRGRALPRLAQTYC